MCFGSSAPKQQAAQAPLPPPAPPEDPPTPPALGADANNASTTASALRRGRQSLRIDLANNASTSGASTGLNIPT